MSGFIYEEAQEDSDDSQFDSVPDDLEFVSHMRIIC